MEPLLGLFAARDFAEFFVSIWSTMYLAASSGPVAGAEVADAGWADAGAGAGGAVMSGVRMASSVASLPHPWRSARAGMDFRWPVRGG